MGVPPGSRSAMTFRPRAVSRSAGKRIYVLLPLRSGPSKVMKIPLNCTESSLNHVSYKRNGYPKFVCRRHEELSLSDCSQPDRQRLPFYCQVTKVARKSY